MPLVFEAMAVISRIESIGGGRGEAGAGGKLKANTNGSAVSVGDPEWHNSLGRPGLLLESVWYPMQSYQCPSGATQAMKCTFVVLQRRKKAT